MRPKKIYGVFEVKWDEAGNPVWAAYVRDETAVEKARRLHRKLPTPETA